MFSGQYQVFYIMCNFTCPVTTLKYKKSLNIQVVEDDKPAKVYSFKYCKTSLMILVQVLNLLKLQ